MFPLSQFLLLALKQYVEHASVVDVGLLTHIFNLFICKTNYLNF